MQAHLVEEINKAEGMRGQFSLRSAVACIMLQESMVGAFLRLSGCPSGRVSKYHVRVEPSASEYWLKLRLPSTPNID